MPKLKNLSKTVFFSPLLLLAVAAQLLFAAPAFARVIDGSGSGSGGGASPQAPSSAGQKVCDNTLTGKKVDQSKVNKCLNQGPLVKDIQTIVNFLSAGVGIIVIGMIILGGIQYSIAGDNANATGAAKTRITNALIALFAFLFAWAFLQWLIPGGIFG